MIVDEGQEAFIKMLLQGLTTPVAAGGNFFLGVCGAAIDQADTLADVAGEPTVTAGYARQAITRDVIGFSTAGVINGVYRLKSKDITFTASGGNFSTSFRRLFLCDVVSGTVGTLFGYSGVFASVQLNSGQSQVTNFEVYFNW